MPTDRDVLQQIKTLVDAQLAATPAPTPDPPPTTTPPPNPAGLSLRLLQWNSHHGAQGTDGKYDPDRFCNWVAKMLPNVCSFNEVETTGTADGFRSRIAQRLPSPNAPWSNGYDGKGNVIVTHLPATYDRWMIDPAIPAYMEVVTLTLPSNTLMPQLVIGSAHLHVSSQASRLAEIDAIVNRTPEMPHVLMADCNFAPGSPEYTKLAAYYADAWVVAKALGRTSNYPGNCDGCTKGTRIDYIWLRKDLETKGVVIGHAEIVDTRDDNGIMPSDHKPYVVTIVI